MKAIHLHWPMVRFASNPWLKKLHRPEPRSFPVSETKADTYSKLTNQLAGMTTSLIVGLFALWLSLTILGTIGLRNVDSEVLHSLGLRIAIASAIALGVCIIALPFILPWFLAFLPAYFLIPGSSVLRNWWAWPVVGVLVGIAALWVDAVVYCLSTGAPVSSLNIALLRLASIPAAVLGGAFCFTAAAAGAACEKSTPPISGSASGFQHYSDPKKQR